MGSQDNAQSHEIRLLGREVRLRSSDERAHVEAVAAYVNETVTALQAQHRKAPLQSILLQATMSLADELLKERARLEAMKDKIRAQSRALLSRLEP